MRRYPHEKRSGDLDFHLQAAYKPQHQPVRPQQTKPQEAAVCRPRLLLPPQQQLPGYQPCPAAWYGTKPRVAAPPHAPFYQPRPSPSLLPPAYPPKPQQPTYGYEPHQAKKSHGYHQQPKPPAMERNSEKSRGRASRTVRLPDGDTTLAGRPSEYYLQSAGTMGSKRSPGSSSDPTLDSARHRFPSENDSPSVLNFPGASLSSVRLESRKPGLETGPSLGTGMFRGNDGSLKTGPSMGIHRHSVETHEPSLGTGFSLATDGSPPKAGPSMGKHRHSLETLRPSLETLGPSASKSNLLPSSSPFTTAQPSVDYTRRRVYEMLDYLQTMEELVQPLGDDAEMMQRRTSASLAQNLRATQRRHERDLGHEPGVKAENEVAATAGERRRQQRPEEIVLVAAPPGGLREATGGKTEMASRRAEMARHSTAVARRHVEDSALVSRSEEVLSGTSGARPSGFIAHSDSLTSLSYRRHAAPSGGGGESYDSCHYPSSRATVADLSPTLSDRQEPWARKDEEVSQEKAATGYVSTGMDDSMASIAPEEEKAWSEQREELRRMEQENQGEKEERSLLVSSEIVSSNIRLSVLSASSPSSTMEEEKADGSVPKVKDESLTADNIEEPSLRSPPPPETRNAADGGRQSGILEEPLLSTHPPRVMEPQKMIPPANGDGTLTSLTTCYDDGRGSAAADALLRQYLKDEDERLRNQSLLLRRRQDVLEESTRTRLAWLQLQKKGLRDSGKEQRVPAIRAKQKALKLRLREETTEIGRLREANANAREDWRHLLEQHEDTIRLKERLRSAGGCVEMTVTETATLQSETASLVTRRVGGDSGAVRSPSPPLISVSAGSIVARQQQEEMNSPHVDDKEQQEWNQRLDREEAEVCRMAQETLAVLDQHNRHQHNNADAGGSSSGPEQRTGSKKEKNCFVTPRSGILTSAGQASEGPSCTAPPESVLETFKLIKPSDYTQDVSKQPSGSQDVSKQSKVSGYIHDTFKQPSSYTQDVAPASASPSQPPIPVRVSLSTSQSPLNITGGNGKPQLCFAAQNTSDLHAQPADTLTVTQIEEPASDLTDIESRIRAMLEELRESKSMAHRLQSEKRKRNKERLKAQEANLQKQLESYNHIIETTRSELNKEPSQGRSISVEQTEEPPTTTITPEQSENPPMTTPALVHGSPECPTSGAGHLLSESLSRPASREARSLSGQAQLQMEASVSSPHASVSVEPEVGAGFTTEDRHPEYLLEQDHKDKPGVPQSLSVADCVPASESEEQQCSPSIGPDGDVEIKTRGISEDKGVPLVSLSGKLHVVTSVLPNISVSSKGRACTLHSTAWSTKTEELLETTGSSLDGYHHDLQLLRENCRSSKPTSLSCPEIRASKDSCNRSPPDIQDKEVEEISDSRRLLDCHSQTVDLKINNKNTNDNCSPAVSRSQPPLSPVPDQMTSVNVGEQVPVSNLHPGALNSSWAGMETMDPIESEESNDDTCDDVTYVEFEEAHGILTPPSKIVPSPERSKPYIDTTEGEESFFDDLSDDNDRNKRDVGYRKSGSGGTISTNKGPPGDGAECQKKTTTSPKGEETLLNRHNHVMQSGHPADNNGGLLDIVMELGDLGQGKQSPRVSIEQKDRCSPGSSPCSPELPLHSTEEVRRLVHAATREIWDACQLAKQNVPSLAGLSIPQPSKEYLGKEPDRQDQDQGQKASLCIRSYRRSVFDLTWEILQDFYTGHSSSRLLCRVGQAGRNNVADIQEFVTAEALKLYGLREELERRTAFRFCTKERDAVDLMLLEELGEEESLWLNYEQDELLVKTQLADGIFDMLLKDSVEALTHISHEQAKADIPPTDMYKG